MQVAEVILPLPLDKLFHYAIPVEMVGSVRPGMRILVQFGARKEYAAIVTRVLEAPDETELKYLISVLDEYPVVLEHQLAAMVLDGLVLHGACRRCYECRLASRFETILTKCRGLGS
jgi:primosomal protein N'